MLTMDVRWRGAALVLLTLLAGCGSSSPARGVVTNPPDQGTPSATVAVGGQVRTVLSPLGLNVRAGPGTTTAVIGTAAQGVTLSVLDRTDQNGGWYKVRGETVTGWITADSSLSAPGMFTAYRSTQRLFNVLYPQDWTFNETPEQVLFMPQKGGVSIAVRTAASVSALPAAPPGMIRSGSEQVVVCGVTGDRIDYTRVAGAASPSPSPGAGSGESFPLLSEIRLRLDAQHALGLGFTYTSASQLQRFRDFYNSLTFPFPACMQVPSPGPSPT